MTRMPLGFPSIDVITGIGGRLSSSDWWNEINESTLWQDGIFYALCAAYALVSSIALFENREERLEGNENPSEARQWGLTRATGSFQLLLLYVANCLPLLLIGILLAPEVLPEISRRVRKGSAALTYGQVKSKGLLASSSKSIRAVRAVVFGFHKQVFLLHPKINLRHWNILRNFGALSKKPQKRKNMLEGIAMQDQVSILVLLDLPGLLFFSTYTLLVLFWAEIYHQASESTSCYGVILLMDYYSGTWYVTLQNSVISCIVYGSFGFSGLWRKVKLLEQSLFFLFTSIFLLRIRIVIYTGFRLFFMLRRFPIESKGRRKKLHEVGSVTGICFTCFLVRCFVVVLSAFDTDASLDVLDHPVLNFIYYMLVEILPSALVLYILRKLPPKRISAQYHPIR
ncbi:hypothetical protein RJ639_045059 [Escallonia herrerae]|uniref:THH1/TOM1/TOM3 domain-containing protein n=1 Tax=Escallonia herrerae TaxID=1293975 RepID=A0AA89B4S3_9ASTE|nr:hypothetical protein RJ639_045059 [Escallonia herrerae]